MGFKKPKWAKDVQKTAADAGGVVSDALKDAGKSTQKYTQTKSNQDERMDEIRSRYDLVMFSQEFAVDDVIIAVADAYLTGGALGNVAMFAEAVRMTSELAKLDSEAPTYGGQITISHHREVGDPASGFTQGKWIHTHNGIMYYLAQGKR